MNNSFTLEPLEKRIADEDTLFNSPVCSDCLAEVPDQDFSEIAPMRVRSQGALNHKSQKEKFFATVEKIRKPKSPFSQRRSFCQYEFSRMVRRIWWSSDQGRRR